MASNNWKSSKWPPKNDDDRTRHSSRSQPSTGSLHGKRKGDTRKIQETLNDMFVNVFDSEIIYSVAHSCGWDLSKSIEALIMLSEGDTAASFKMKIMSREAVPGSKGKAPDILENNFCDGSNKLALNASSTTPSKNESTKILKSKSVMMNAGHSKIKVMYKGQNDPDFSDDDADIVIEEEKEMEENETESGFENASSQSMCQFLTHVIPSKQDATYNILKSSGSARQPMVSKSHNLSAKCKESISYLTNNLSSSASVTKKTKHWPQLARIKKQITENIKVMVLLRGVPGSGKTSLARHIIKVTYGENHHKYVFSADEYFVLIGRGKYTFDPKLLPEAHKWNQQRVHLEAKNGTNPILVDNTNIEAWELKPYVETAVEYGYNLELIEPRTSWRYNSFELERKNIHNVPRRKIEDMLFRFERDLTPAKLMMFFDLKYAPHNLPPQYTHQCNNVLLSKDCDMNNPKKKSKVKKESEDKGNLGAKSNCQENYLSNSKQMHSVCQNEKLQESQSVCSWEAILSKLDNQNPVSYSEAEDSSNSDIKSSGQETSTYKTFHFSSSNYETNYKKFSEEKYSAFSDVEVNQLKNLNANLCHENVQLLDNGRGEEEIELDESANDWGDENVCNDPFWELDNLSDVNNSDNVPEICHPVCTDYVLVMSDGTLLPQKSYSEEENLVNVFEENPRTWEYLLMTENSKLIFNSRKCSQKSSDAGRESESESEICPKTQHKGTISPIQDVPDEIVHLNYLSCPDGDAQESVRKFQEVEQVTTMTSKGDSLNLGLKSNQLNIAFDCIEGSPVQLCCPSDTSIRNDISSLLDQPQDSDDKFDLLLDLSPQKSVINSQGTRENSAHGVAVVVEQDEPVFSECVINIVSDREEMKTPENATNSFEGVSKSESEQSCYEGFGVDVTQSISPVKPNGGLDYNNIELLVDMSITSEKEKEVLHVKDFMETELEAMDGQDSNVKDILTQWEEGTGWDDGEENKSAKVKQNDDCTTPKPARHNRRLTVSSSPLKLSTENVVEKVLEPTVSGIWSVVDEPLKSWEVSKDKEENLECREVTNEAQPQREQFASSKGTELAGTLSSKHFEVPADSDYRGKSDITSLSVMKDFKTCSEDLFQPRENLSSTSNDLSGTETSIGTMETSTNTHHLDFRILSSINDGKEINDLEYKVISAFGRNIIENEDVLSAHKSRKVLPVLLLDKSSMTSEECFVLETENIREQLNELIRMFPNCSVDDLLEIFERCNRDINWTVDLLLESASQGIVISTVGTSSQIATQDDPLSCIKTLPAIEKDTLNNPILKSGDTEGFSTSGSSSSVVQSEINTKGPCSNKRNGKKDRNAPVSEVSLLIKKQLEENIVISDDYYSEHVSRIRKLRHGELIDPTETSVVRDADSMNTIQMAELDYNSDLASRIVEEPAHILCPDAQEWEGSGLYPQDSLEDEDIVSLTFDSDFADQLHGLFGTVPLPFSQAGVKPSLNLPLSLARQLHYYLMEAEQNMYDVMMQEDEELARKLQLQEDELDAGAISSTPNQVPDLREIMDMEMALALYKVDQEQNSHESKDDMATKLTKDLLCEWFPTLPRDVLVNVFEAHNGSFEETIEVLIASTDEDNSVRVVMTPEARVAHEKALLQKANLESQKSKETSEPRPVCGEKITQEKALEDAKYYRSEATRHYKLRYECQQKAQKTFKRGLPAVAAYYSQMASLHKERIEKNNAMAASSLLLAHSLGNLTTTLDLHFLYVVEALQVLDMFLDRHVSKLLESGHRLEHLFVITGRGARSSGGRSRIKPAVIQRLEQRGLRHMEVNPGLLKVTITRNTTSSTRISS